MFQCDLLCCGPPLHRARLKRLSFLLGRCPPNVQKPQREPAVDTHSGSGTYLTPCAEALVHIESTSEGVARTPVAVAAILYLFLYLTVYIMILYVVVCML